MEWVVSSTPRPHFTPRRHPVPIVHEAWWAPGAVWTGEKSRPHHDTIPDRPARSQSLYRLSYRAHIYIHIHMATSKLYNFIFTFPNTYGLMMVDWWSRNMQLIWICYNKGRVSIKSLLLRVSNNTCCSDSCRQLPPPPQPLVRLKTLATQHGRQFLPAIQHNLQTAWMISLTLSKTYIKFSSAIFIWVHFGSS